MWEKERERERERVPNIRTYIFIAISCLQLVMQFLLGPKIFLLILYAAGYFYFHMSLIINGQEYNKFFNGI